MKKILSITFVSLALAALASPAHATRFGGSVRGDVGVLTNQVPYFIVQSGATLTPNIPVETVTHYSHRKDGQWEFTGRLFAYLSCAPCSTYVAASWQGSNHNVHSCRAVDTATDLAVLIPLRTEVFTNTVRPESLVAYALGSPVSARVDVKNKFSKAKLGVGLDLIKTCCFNFTMEVGGNYLDAKLNTNKVYTITQTVAQGIGTISVPPGVVLGSPAADALPFDYVINDNTHQKTEGLGLYASFKAEYNFPSTCWGNCFGFYGKAEVADIIGRQKYREAVCYENEFAHDIEGIVPIVPPNLYVFGNRVCNQYNNIVEVDLEAALVYKPCFKCWSNLNFNVALGVRTDSFVNLFAKPTGYTDTNYLSLTRPTVFLELGIKV